MKKITAIRLEVGYCRTNGIPYPAEWDEALREANKGPLDKCREGQKRMNDPDTGQAMLYSEYTLKLNSGKTILVPLYSQSPQSEFYLPGLLSTHVNWGLNTTRMADWWVDFNKNIPNYQAFSAEHNCVGIALRGLKEGGSECFVKLPTVRAYGEPLQVASYARELEGEILHLEGLTAALEKNIDSNHLAQTPVPANQLCDSLWRFDIWKQASALGVLQFRSETIREIDEQLALYGRLTWKYGFLERYAALVKLFVAVCKHRDEKSDSKRSEAVAQLGKQILALVKGRRFYDC